MNLWILTEEKPKISTLWGILELYCRDFGGKILSDCNTAKIKPLIKDRRFLFTYEFENVSVEGIDNIFIKTVSGKSSFFDFLLFRQVEPPEEGCMKNLLMAIEETKTSDSESRNTGVSQRGSKFVYIKAFAPQAKLYMFYNDELNEQQERTPSATSVFGTNILLTLGVDIVGKDTEGRFRPFTSVEEMIAFKSAMRRPPKNNVPIDITMDGDTIYVSGRLDKPQGAGNIGHDPSIGALSMISACLRKLGWRGDIVITLHGVSQEYADRNSSNKFFYIAQMLGVRLEGITMNSEAKLPKQYWRYEMRSEKVASILLHIVAEYSGMREVYQNHAGCERGYFRTQDGDLITLPKERLVTFLYEKKRKKKGGYKVKNGITYENLLLPDLILCDLKTKSIILIEGKQLQNQAYGLEEIENYYGIKEDYINKYYSDFDLTVGLSLFGGRISSTSQLSGKVILYLDGSGKIYLNNNSAKCIIDAFNRFSA